MQFQKKTKKTSDSKRKRNAVCSIFEKKRKPPESSPEFCINNVKLRAQQGGPADVPIPKMGYKLFDFVAIEQEIQSLYQELQFLTRLSGLESRGSNYYHPNPNPNVRS